MLLRRIFGIFDSQVVVAGFAGGIGRGLVEGPFEYIKTRRQVQGQWKLREIMNGSGATIFRNSFLFSSFVIYIDLSNQLVPGGLGPFWTGAICSNLGNPLLLYMYIQVHIHILYIQVHMHIYVSFYLYIHVYLYNVYTYIVNYL